MDELPKNDINKPHPLVYSISVWILWVRSYLHYLLLLFSLSLFNVSSSACQSSENFDLNVLINIWAYIIIVILVLLIMSKDVSFCSYLVLLIQCLLFPLSGNQLYSPRINTSTNSRTNALIHYLVTGVNGQTGRIKLTW